LLIAPEEGFFVTKVKKWMPGKSKHPLLR